MRLPTEAQLSKEQKEVCTAPPKGSSLVVGPPGSGKTVAAIFRKRYLEKLDEKVEAVAWNNVLSKFSNMTQTFESWHNSWWKTATGHGFPKNRHDPRKHWRPDYEKSFKSALNEHKDSLLQKGNWGHLILDEAQDFDTNAHRMLSTVQYNSECHAQKPSSLLILADENQRITQNNSKIEEIRNAHNFVEDDIYYLTKNYRNTREIAVVAGEFYVGAKSGIPDLPQRSGNKPKLLTSCTIDDAVTRIANHAKTFRDYEIGVLVSLDNTRKKIVNKLEHRLRGSGIDVQTYHSRKGGGKELADKLIFDKQETVTVLCFASAKGVEFDSVFLPELQQMRTADAEETHNKMMLYVMTSRARSHLTLMFNDPGRTSQAWNLFPNSDRLDQFFDID